MRAMVLAAGLGTRLRPLTNDRPKALVEINGRSLLEITLERLREFGVTDVIINAHHFADMMIEFVRRNRSGMNLEISREEVLLDTGGGLKRAAHFFLNQGSAEPFLLHNVDVISNIDLRRMIEAHHANGALATLAVQHRKTSRYLLFDEQQQLVGRRKGEGDPEMVRSAINPQALAFCGIHVISPRLLQLLTEDGVFSIINAYLRLARSGEKILGFRADDYIWRDLGRIENIAQVESQLKAHGS